MAKSDKDIKQKELAIRYCLIAGLIPFLEVIVENRKELSDTSTIITDIDVLGITIDPSGNNRKTIFDCKTLNKTSPINRAFWASGLMTYTDSDESFIILKKKASEAHRLSAKTISVHLFNEQQFSGFAESLSQNFHLDYCYSSNIEAWLSFSEIYSKIANFERFGGFLNNYVPLETEPTRGIRRLIAGLKKGKGEFNPDKSEHQAVFQHALMCFSYLMSKVVHDLKTVVDQDIDLPDFEKILQFYIWGGKDQFIKLQHMHSIIARLSKSQDTTLSFDSWPSFVELTRKLLDAPFDVIKCCLPLREISLRSATSLNNNKDNNLGQLISNNSRIRQFIISQAKYLIKASKMPNEFEDNLNSIFDSLIL